MALCSRLFESLYRVMEPLKNRETISVWFDQVPEPGPDDEAMLACVRTGLPDSLHQRSLAG